MSQNANPTPTNFTPRSLHEGMGQAVAERTILRKKDDGVYETWGEVAKRVALGNSLLCPDEEDRHSEEALLESHIARATLLMSGRHLQHGDETQPDRNMEIYTNCASAPASFLSFYLLLNGSGVGRSYDDAMMVVDWDNAPNIRVVLDDTHPDFDFVAHESVRDAKHKYGGDSKKVMWFTVPDSREGWAKALEMWELAAFEKIHADKMLILDFSQVRASGSPIGGMQNRPASGPIPLMNAFSKASSLKGAGLSPWRQAMYVDHYFAECVLVGGARRAARMATKSWKDPSAVNFVEIKRPIEYIGMTPDEVVECRNTNDGSLNSFLWSSNNSVTVDAEFWKLLDIKRGEKGYTNDMAKHARKVWKRIVDCSYGDGTGEPGLINVDKLSRNDDGWDDLNRGDYVGYWKYQLQDETEIMMSKLAKKAKRMKHNMITNPCGEIALSVLGGYCVIADVVPFHADSLDDAEDAFRVATRALMRVNLMDSLYKREVNRTNRIGVGMTGVHEFAWKFFNVGFNDLVNPDFDAYTEELQAMADTKMLRSHESGGVRSAAFWLTLNRFNAAVHDEAVSYSEKLGVKNPHTETTIKPAGCQIPSTMVSTKDGIMTLAEIGDQGGEQWQDHDLDVYTEDGLRNSPKFFVNGLAKTLRIQTDGGITLESTLNHQYRVIRNNEYVWVRADEMMVGDQIPYSVGEYDGGSYQSLNAVSFERHPNATQQVDIKQPTVLTEDLAWFLGAYFGDGSNHTRSIRIHGNALEKKGFADIQRIVLQEFGINASIGEDSREGNRASIGIDSNQIRPWLAANGIEKQKTADIEIPLIIRKSPKSVIEAFIDGYYVADGCDKNESGMTSVTVSKVWAEQLVVLLRAIGRDAKLREMPPTSTSKGTRMRYWVSERKGRSADPRYISNIITESWEILNAVGHKTFGVDTVTAITASESLTYDIEVSENHNYVANSYISHNTTSKLFGLSEGWHLPTMEFYLRWVQFRNGDPLIDSYKAEGYPVRELTQYRGTSIVGFPTAPVIADLGMGDLLVTAGDASPDDQYKWLMLGEKFYIHGVDPVTLEPHTDRNTGNQISYTLKYKPDVTDIKHFGNMMRQYQPLIRACSVMPQENTSSYEYLPEEAVTKAQYENIVNAIKTVMEEDIGAEHVLCDGGACPVDFTSGDKE